MGAVLCMNLLTLSGCDRVVQSAVVEEKNQTEQKKEDHICSSSWWVAIPSAIVADSLMNGSSSWSLL